MLGGGTQKCDRVPLLVMEGLGAGAPGARGTPKRPREEEEDPRQQEWEEELRQQAAAGWPELTCENHAHDNDDPDDPDAGLVRSDPSVGGRAV